MPDFTGETNLDLLLGYLDVRSRLELCNTDKEALADWFGGDN